MILSWTRFSLVLVVIALAFGAAIFPTLTKDGGIGIAAATVVFAISMMLFFAFRFRKFRDLTASTREIDRIGELTHKFFGPVASFFYWLFGALILSSAVLAALL